MTEGLRLEPVSNLTRATLHPRVAFAVGTGRCGTHLLAQLFAEEPSVQACHESDPANEAFHRYCRWNELPVDSGGFLAIKRREIDAAHLSDRLFFEASAHLSLSIVELHSAFQARFVLIVRDPVETVNSLWVKGWYRERYVKDDPRLAIGYHDIGAFDHFLGRIIPNGSEYRLWERMTRIGKLAWFWSALHRRVLTQFAHLPQHAWRIVRLEDLDYSRYVELAKFVGVEPTLSAERFTEVVDSRPGSLWQHRTMGEWTHAELTEFTEQVESTARVLGYQTDFHARWRTSSAGREPHAASDAAVVTQSSGDNVPGPTIFPLMKGAIIAPLSDSDRTVDDAAWAIQLGIRQFRLIWNHSRPARGSALIEKVSSLNSGIGFIIDIGDGGGYVALPGGLGTATIVLEARRPQEVTRFRAAMPGSIVVPKLTRMSALLRWREFAQGSRAVYLSWPGLLAEVEPDDLIAWMQHHYDEALANGTLVALELDVEGDQRMPPPPVVEWAIARELVVCASECDTPARWRVSMTRLANLRAQVHAARPSPAASPADENG